MRANSYCRNTFSHSTSWHTPDGDFLSYGASTQHARSLKQALAFCTASRQVPNFLGGGGVIRDESVSPEVRFPLFV